MTSETTNSDDWRVCDWNYGNVVSGKLNDTVASFISCADAEFAVKAVNAHEALVAMVRELRGMVRVTGPMTDVRERAEKLLSSLE